MSDLTIEQIQEAIKANPSLEQSVVTTALQTEVGKSVLNNHLKTSQDTTYKTAQRETYGLFDDTLGSLGYEKKQGEQSTAFLKRVIKSEQDKSSNINATIEEKEDAKKLAEALKSDFANRESELLSTIEQRDKKIQNILIGADINSINFDFDPAINEQVVKVFAEREKDLLRSNAKIIDGITVYYDENDKPILNELMGYATAKEILTKKLEPILKKEPTAGGGAGQEKKPTTSIKGGAIISDNLNKATTRETLFAAFLNDAKRQALVQGSEDFNKVWNETKKHYSFNDMPEE